jgi:hypothetical protein
MSRRNHSDIPDIPDIQSVRNADRPSRSRDIGRNREAGADVSQAAIIGT